MYANLHEIHNEGLQSWLVTSNHDLTGRYHSLLWLYYIISLLDKAFRAGEAVAISV